MSAAIRNSVARKFWTTREQIKVRYCRAGTEMMKFTLRCTRIEGFQLVNASQTNRPMRGRKQMIMEINSYSQSNLREHRRRSRCDGKLGTHQHCVAGEGRGSILQRRVRPLVDDIHKIPVA